MVPLRREQHATNQPVQHRLSRSRADRTRSPRASIYVIVFGSCAGPDRALRGRRPGQRRDRCTPRHAAASRLQMAQTLLRPASGRTDRSASGRTAPEFSPLTWWLPSRRWPANSQRRPTSPSRWLAGSARIWPAPPSSKASPPRSRAPRSGAGSAPMRSSPGSTAPAGARRGGVLPRRLPGLPSRLGCAPRQGVRPLRADHRHRPLRPAGQPGHDHRALRHRASSVLGGRQRLLPPRTGQHRPAPGSLAQTAPDPPARARLLAQSVEIYFSVVQRKVVSPNDFHTLDEVETRPLDFQQYYEQIATPFEWKFTKDDLNALLERIAAHENAALTPAA